ncbi:MAG: hypothetical protein IJ710_10650 [Prevotella sp.]|nr:hypothetical protein [Prevotella sp.]
MNDTLRRILTYVVLPYVLYGALVCWNIYTGDELANNSSIMILLPLTFSIVLGILLYVCERKWLQRHIIIKVIGYIFVLNTALSLTNGAIQSCIPPAHLATITADTQLPNKMSIDIDSLDIDTRLGAFHATNWIVDTSKRNVRKQKWMKLRVEIYRPLRQRPNVWVKAKYQTNKLNYIADDSERERLAKIFAAEFLQTSKQFDWNRALSYKRQLYDVDSTAQWMRSNEFRQRYDSLYGAGSLSRFDLTQDAVVLEVKDEKQETGHLLTGFAFFIFALLCTAFAVRLDRLRFQKTYKYP